MSNSDFDAAYHHKALADIRRAVMFVSRYNLSPRDLFASVVGAVASAACYIATESFPVTLAVGVLVFLIAFKFSKFRRSYVYRLDALLAKYKPVHLEAFRQLQAEVRKSGSYTIELLDEWISIEAEAIRAATGEKAPLESLFLDRKI